jgi:hypothetical protein
MYLLLILGFLWVVGTIMMAFQKAKEDNGPEEIGLIDKICLLFKPGVKIDGTVVFKQSEDY